MIVTIHPRVANRHKTLDPNMRIVVQPAPGKGIIPLVEVQGNQLLLAGIHTLFSKGEAIKPNVMYYMTKESVQPVCYDCATLSKKILSWHPRADTRQLLRIQKYDDDGWPMFRIKDIIGATKSIECIAYVDPAEPHLVAVRHMMVDIHPYKED